MKKSVSDSKSVKNKKSVIPLILTVFFIYLLVVMLVALVIDARHVRFYMNGDREMTLEYGEDFIDPGVTAVTTGSLFGDGSPLPISIDGRVDSESLQSFTLSYKTEWLFSEYSTERIVHVKDTTAPTIELKHRDGYKASRITGYEEEGFSATDRCDGDLTASVIRTERDGRVLYSVTDSSGNTASVERVIEYAAIPPKLTLIGDENVVITARQSYVDAGCTAVDGMGRDITAELFVENEVIPYAAGNYQVTYSVMSEDGEIISLARNVTVVPMNSPETVTPDKPTIYLTFDDGPSPYTSRLLDVLASYGAKATFFVTGANPKYYDQIGRAHREGHAIGVHTYSHEYNTIYSSEEAFFEDFNAMQEIILAQTGSYTKLYRFPGGSSNTVSRFNRGIMTRLTTAVSDLGYRFFDWNINSGDAGETTKTDVVAENIIEGCAGKSYSVVLQHDIKDFSVAAVEKVLIWGLSNGYTFCALNESSPDVHHGVNN